MNNRNTILHYETLMLFCQLRHILRTWCALPFLYVYNSINGKCRYRQET